MSQQWRYRHSNWTNSVKVSWSFLPNKKAHDISVPRFAKRWTKALKNITSFGCQLRSFARLYLLANNLQPTALACVSLAARRIFWILNRSVYQLVVVGFGASDGYAQVSKLDIYIALRVWLSLLTRLQIGSTRDCLIKTLNPLQHWLAWWLTHWHQLICTQPLQQLCASAEALATIFHSAFLHWFSEVAYPRLRFSWMIFSVWIVVCVFCCPCLILEGFDAVWFSCVVVHEQSLHKRSITSLFALQ